MEPTNPELIAKYIELRDMKAELKANYDARVAAIDEAQDAVSAELSARLTASGLDSMKAAGIGTVTKRAVRKVVMRDSGEFLSFVRDNSLPELLQARLSSTAVEEYVRDGNTLPPGLGYDDTTTLTVRRA